MLAFGGLFEDDDFRAQVMCGDRSRDTRSPKPDNDDIGFRFPIRLH